MRQRVGKNNKELSSMTRPPAANRKEAESRGGSRLGPLMVPVWSGAENVETGIHLGKFMERRVC